jgi:thiol-disulfide isomerase/thioredoxin
MEKLNSFFKKYKNHIVIILVIILIIILYIYFAYYRKIKENFKSNNEIDYSNGDTKNAKVCFFYVDWCPHCKTALPEWNAFKNEMNNTDINGYKLTCVEYNCTTETSEVTSLINQYNIEGYPTVKMIKDNEVFDFDAKPTTSYLKQFCYTMI